MKGAVTLTIAAMSIPAGTPAEPTALEAARAGDLTAFDTLMRQYERLVLVTALRLTGSLPDAQDISQDVFLKLYRNLSKLDPASLSSWLYRVTVNACHDQRRRRRPEDPVEDAGELRDTTADPHQVLTAEERRRVLALSLRMLPEKERAALVLRDLEGLSTEQTAQILGSSEATVRSQVSKARVKVKDFVERYFPEAHMSPNDNEYLDILQAAHNDPLDPAHYTAVRARVLAEIERTRTPWRRLAWLSGVGTLAATLLLTLALRRPTLPPLPRVAVAPPGSAADLVGGVPHPAVHPVRAQRASRPHRQPLTIKLQTSDPNIVIYWIAD